MPNHKSAIKRSRQNKRRRVRNMAVRGEARTAVKKVRAAVDAGDKAAAKLALLEATSLLDGAAAKGVHHRRNTGRRVSRLTLQVNKMP